MITFKRKCDSSFFHKFQLYIIFKLRFPLNNLRILKKSMKYTRMSYLFFSQMKCLFIFKQVYV